MCDQLRKGGPMRLTLAGTAGSREVDLDVPDDVRLGDLRPHLAAAAGRPDLALGSTALAIDEAVLDDDHLTGQVPGYEEHRNEESR